MQRRETHDLRSQLLQEFQIVLIVEGKSLVFRHSNSDRWGLRCSILSGTLRRRILPGTLRYSIPPITLWYSSGRLHALLLHSQNRCTLRDFKQKFQIQRLFKKVCRAVDLLQEIRYLIGLHKPQVPAFNVERLVRGKTPQYRYRRFTFQPAGNSVRHGR